MTDKKSDGNRKKSPLNGQPVPSGRPKGCVNKFTTLKKSFLNVFERMGGDEALLEFAKGHKALFYQMLTKLFPQEVEHSGEIKTEYHVVYDEDQKG